jgi:hypothetical protein
MLFAEIDVAGRWVAWDLVAAGSNPKRRKG